MVWISDTKRAFAVLAALMMASGPVSAGELSERDLQYLGQLTGMGANEGLLTDMTPAEGAELHRLINEPVTQEYSRRDTLVLGNLMRVHARQCADWAKEHKSPSCPPARNPAAQPGKEIADRLCNSCHLLGTIEALSFHKLAANRTPTADQLKAAVTSGHRMSPISLNADELEQLRVYIDDLR